MLATRSSPSGDKNPACCINIRLQNTHRLSLSRCVSCSSTAPPTHSCLVARSIHLAPNWLFVVVVVVLFSCFCWCCCCRPLSRIISLPRTPLSSKPSKRPTRPSPLGHSTNGTAPRGHMTRIWRLSTNRSQREGERNRQTDCNVKKALWRPKLCLCMVLTGLGQTLFI